MERTYKYKQKDIKSAVDLNTARKIFNLTLPKFGPYSIDYSRNGRQLLIGGRKGHVAMIDALKMEIITELHLRETVKDIQMLHNETLFAVAQKKYVYIYDNNGIELHCMRTHIEPNKLELLLSIVDVVGIVSSILSLNIVANLNSRNLSLYSKLFL